MRNYVDDPQIVKDALPMRQSRRPLECQQAKRDPAKCWVLVGRSALNDFNNQNTRAPRCLSCGGKLLPILLAGMLIAAAVAHAGEVADCAHDRFVEWMLNSEPATAETTQKEVRLIAKVCVGKETDVSLEDATELSDGIGAALHQVDDLIAERLKSMPKGGEK